MTPARRRQINELAEKLREGLDIRPPIDMKEVAERLGGQVRYVDEEDLPYEALVEKKDDAFVITLVSSKIRQRQNFSIAHELGHLFIHMGYLINPTKWTGITTYEDGVRARYGYSEEELEANEFAGAFLMPSDEFLTVAERCRSNDHYKLDEIARNFAVSVQAAKTRGQWLGLFSWG